MENNKKIKYDELCIDMRVALILIDQSFNEIGLSDSAVRMDPDSKRLDVDCAIGSPREVGKVELDLVPCLVEVLFPVDESVKIHLDEVYLDFLDRSGQSLLLFNRRVGPGRPDES